jgi:conjugal transfer pilus assembly protein TraW
MRRVVASILSVAVAATAAAGERRVIGQTFPIAEPDLLQEIRQRAAATDWKAVMQRKDPSTFSGFQTVGLPPAKADASFLFDPTYTLPQDVIDHNGAVLYPAGTTINVYARRQFPGRTIVIAADPAHLRWLDEVAKPTAADKVLVSGMNMVEARQIAGPRRIFALDQRIAERFGLRAVPSIVQQEGTQLRVREYAVPLAPAPKVANREAAP